MSHPGWPTSRTTFRPASRIEPSYERSGLVLRLRYPRTGLVQEQEFAVADSAIQAAHAHYARFPAGLAQISDAMGDVIHSHAELRELYEHRSR